MTLSILQAIDDDNLFGRWFKDPETWTAWRAFLAALFALSMSDEQLAIYETCTGRTGPPTVPASECWLPIGRRGGKSFILALTAVYLATFRDYRPYLQFGERGVVTISAVSRDQAQVIFKYVRALLLNVPMLALMVQRETAESFDLSNEVSIEVGTASYRSARGRTIVAALCDEIAFWHSEDSANPDFEILDALRPAMSTIPGAMLLCASSPYSKRGALFEAHGRYFGKDGPVLVWRAPTRTMNPTVPQRIIDAAIERDPAAAASEYMAEFRNDISGFVPLEVVRACVVDGEIERPFDSKHRYVAFVDPSGGTSDSMTLAIGHREKDTTVLDVLREIRAPFNPEDATDEFAKLLRSYSISRVVGDRYAGEWPREQFRKRGIHYVPSELPKSGLYLDLLPKLNSRQIRLLDNTRLVNQLAGLERRTARGGKDSIDHAPNSHDDVANVCAGLASICVKQNTTICTELFTGREMSPTNEAFAKMRSIPRADNR